MILKINSLEQCIESIDQYDKVKFELSHGIEFPGFNLTNLGFGNLISVYMGFSILNFHSKNSLSFIDFYKNRIHYITKHFFRWYARSSFAIDEFVRVKERYTKFYDNKKDFESYIDTENKILYLSTNLVNSDENFLRPIKDTISNNFLNELNIPHVNITQKSKKDHLSVGLHLRRGDFIVAKKQDGFMPNLSPSDEIQFIILNKVIDKNNIFSIDIYSDQKLSLDYINNFRTNLSIPLLIHNHSEAGNLTFHKMLQNDILIQSNSTLSTWASILSGSKAIYPWEKTPYNADYFFPNQFISFRNYLES